MDIRATEQVLTHNFHTRKSLIIENKCKYDAEANVTLSRIVEPIKVIGTV